MIIAGVDEAGRGALIGNVVAAAVILPPKFDSSFIIDSKKLKEEQRTKQANYIKEIAIDYAIGQSSALEIDQINIHHATLLAMKRAIEQLKQTVDEVWVDGKFCPDVSYACKAFVGGDNLYAPISAASILAKTHRDQQLIELDQHHPNYGFAKHKGYPTKAHIQAIQAFGILDDYRKSYKTIKQLL